MKVNQIAVILFTLREHVKTPEDFRRTIDKVAKIGYKAVQVSGMAHDVMPAREIAQVCKDAGITICATHEPSDMILHQTDAIIERLKDLGTQYTAYPAPAGIELSDETAVKTWLENLETAAVKMREAGLKLAYHNHAMEFYRLNGKLIYERIFEETSLYSELDTYWAQAGGVSPRDWVECLAAQKRLPLLHMKDMRVELPNTSQFAPIGSGNIDFKPIIAAADKGGCEYYIVEQDHTYGRDPFECIADSFNYMRDVLCD